MRDAPTERGGYRSQLSFLGGASRFRASVTAREFFNTPGGIDEFLFASEKRMASGANADFNITTRRARVINRAARADNVGLVILRMNARFHVRNGARNVIAPGIVRNR